MILTCKCLLVDIFHTHINYYQGHQHFASGRVLILSPVILSTLYSSVERGTQTIKCLAQEHNTMIQAWPGPHISEGGKGGGGGLDHISRKIKWSFHNSRT